MHRTPGGSSAGSGVAVAAASRPGRSAPIRAAPCGSPAWCGVVGLKTTIGRISTYGVLPLAATLDTPGPIARDVEDAALCDGPPRCRPAGYSHAGGGGHRPGCASQAGCARTRVAVMPRREREGVAPDILARFDASLDVLANLGGEVVQLASLPLSFAEFAERTGTIIAAEGYSVVGDLCDQTDLPLDEDVRPRILAGKRVSARQYLDALAERGASKPNSPRPLTPSTSWPRRPSGRLPFRWITWTKPRHRRALPVP